MATVTYRQDNAQDDQEEAAKRGMTIQGSEAPTAGAVQPSAATGANPGSGDYTRSKFVSAKKYIDKNVGAGQTDLTKPYLEKMAKESEGNRQALGQYQNTLQEQQKGAQSIAGMAGAAGQDEGAFSKVMGFLNQKPEVAQFSAPREQTDFSGLTSLGTQAGVRSALKDQAKQSGISRYGRGMAALDAATFAADPNARQKLTEANTAYSQFKKEQGEIADQASKAAQQARGNIMGAQEATKKNLSSRAASLEQAGIEAAKNFDWAGAANKIS